MPISTDSFLSTFPGPDTLYPRDKKIPAHSLDHLFLAAILVNWRPPTSSLNVYREKEYTCYLADRDGSLYHPVTGEPAGHSPETPHHQLGRSALNGYFRNGFCHLRNGIINDRFHDQSLVVKGLVIIDSGRKIDAGIQQLDAQLKWKLTGERSVDALADHLLPVGHGEDQTPPDSRLICPVDGRVEATEADIISPEWTWSRQVGRHFRLAVCPHCLGVFYSRLHAMS